MNIYYIDGFTTLSNPSTKGGYTITDIGGNILKQKFVKSSDNLPTITNNYTEFLSLEDCLIEFCNKGDIIKTDSQNNIAWANLRFSRKSKRKDLIPMAQNISKLIKDKKVVLEWVSRDENYAGFVNERMFDN